jgi:hypothetical protein
LHHVFKRLLAAINKADRDLILNLTPSVHRKRPPPGLGDSFGPRRNVDGISQKIAIFNHHVANMDPDAKLNTLFRR